MYALHSFTCAFFCSQVKTSALLPIPTSNKGAESGSPLHCIEQGMQSMRSRSATAEMRGT